MLEKEGRLPDAVLACVGGGSNAIGAFYNLLKIKTFSSSAVRQQDAV